jgi:hypothetical protein
VSRRGLLFTWRELVASDRGPASPTRRHVLITLSLNMNQGGGSCYPSTARLAEMTGLSERSVCSHLEAAEAEGWIRRGRHGSGRGWKLTAYQAAIPDTLNEVQHVRAAGTETGSARQRSEGAEPHARGTEPHARGTEPDDTEVLKEVQSISSYNSPRISPRISDVDDRFDGFWSVYPPRAGGNPKRRAQHAWNARLKEGADPQAIIAGARRYRQYLEATHSDGTQYVMQAATFVGPERHWEEPWTPPPPLDGRRSPKTGPPGQPQTADDYDDATEEVTWSR